MNVQEVLEEYNSIKAKINILYFKIEKIKDEITDIQSAQLTGMPKASGFVESSLERQVIQKQEKIDDIEKKVKELQYEINIVEKLMKTLKKSNQDIIEMRYFKKMSIEQISTEKDRTYSTIAKIIKNSVQKMQKEYDKSERC